MMKKKVTSMLLGVALMFTLLVPAMAAGPEEGIESETVVATEEFQAIPEEEMVINDAEFLADATISTTSLGNDVYEIEVRGEESGATAESGEASSVSASIIAFGEEELGKIEDSIQRAATGTGSSDPKASGWVYMGNSLYLETTINYSYKTVSGEKMYKMTSVKTKVQIQNGTTFSNRSVKFVSHMALQTGKEFTKAISSSAPSTCTVSAPSDWGYVTKEGLLYGVHFYCTANRPGGNSQKIDFYHDLFE